MTSHGSSDGRGRGGRLIGVGNIWVVQQRRKASKPGGYPDATRTAESKRRGNERTFRPAQRCYGSRRHANLEPSGSPLHFSTYFFSSMDLRALCISLAFYFDSSWSWKVPKTCCAFWKNPHPFPSLPILKNPSFTAYTKSADHVCFSSVVMVVCLVGRSSEKGQ